ncbi:MAG: hypothetical protein EA377_05880 [Phycisphaerales bacterium]|nr:MAG: hypothetical protein EA377_05880 [Phycisphaerales bacterium]
MCASLCRHTCEVHRIIESTTESAVPELPEVEHLRRSLESSLVGAKVLRAVVHRRDIVRLGRPTSNNGSQRPGRAPAMGTALLRGDRIDRLERRGKQLAIIGRSAGIICVHLGMSGQLRHVRPHARTEPNTHIHVRWWLEGKDGQRGQLIFRDPRRFGGVWTFPDQTVLDQSRWSRLGPDALTIRPDGTDQRPEADVPASEGGSAGPVADRGAGKHLCR